MVELSRNKLIIIIVVIVIICAFGYYLWYNSGDRPEKRNKVECTAKEPPIPTNVFLESDKKFEMKVSWNGCPECSSYKVYRYLKDPLTGIDPKEVVKTEDTFVKFSNIKNSEQWIRVRAVNDCAISDFSETKSINVNSELVVSYESLDPYYNNDAECESGMTLSWNKQPGASAYGIFIKGEKYDRQLFIDDSQNYMEKLTENARMETILPVMDEPIAIVMTAVNSSGQSDLVLVDT